MHFDILKIRNFERKKKEWMKKEVRNKGGRKGRDKGVREKGRDKEGRGRKEGSEQSKLTLSHNPKILIEYN